MQFIFNSVVLAIFFFYIRMSIFKIWTTNVTFGVSVRCSERAQVNLPHLGCKSHRSNFAIPWWQPQVCNCNWCITPPRTNCYRDSRPLAAASRKINLSKTTPHIIEGMGTFVSHVHQLKVGLHKSVMRSAELWIILNCISTRKKKKREE